VHLGSVYREAGRCEEALIPLETAVAATLMPDLRAWFWPSVTHI
jgi:hypothetical protein